ncbi:glyoxalase, partial [Burkholderia sp. SIMBA_045]
SLNLRSMLRSTAAASAVLAALLVGAPAHADETHLDDIASPAASTRLPAVAVGPQYDTTHVCVAPEDFDRFTDSFVATFGGK